MTLSANSQERLCTAVVSPENDEYAGRDNVPGRRAAKPGWLPGLGQPYRRSELGLRCGQGMSRGLSTLGEGPSTGRPFAILRSL